MFGRKAVTRYYGEVVARYIKQTQTVPGRLPQPPWLKNAWHCYIIEFSLSHTQNLFFES